MTSDSPRFIPGRVGELEVTVTADMTASAFRNAGVDVLATPYLIWLIEAAAVRAIESELLEGEATVGTMVNVKHEGAAGIGAPVLARARLTTANGLRISFDVEAWSGDTRLMSGTHERFVIDLQRFLHRAKKRQPAQE